MKYWWLMLLKGIILIFLSIYTFSYPVDALVGLAIYIGISLLVTGIFLAILSISSRDTDENWGWKLAEGLIDILFAFVLLSNPAITAATLPFVVGFWIMMYGVMIFAGSFKMKKIGSDTWWVGMLGGLVIILFGILLINNIIAGVITISYWIGIGFLIAGILSISGSLQLRKSSV